jgi:hypothetical protein
MKEDYKIKVETKPLTVNIEVDVVETLKKCLLIPNSLKQKL